MYEDHRMVAPVALSSVTKMSCGPLMADWKALKVGKSADWVVPPTYAFPAASTASPRATSTPDPPRYVENTSPVPPGLSLVRNASWLPPSVWSLAPAVVGKLE